MGEHTNSASTKAKNAAASSMVAAAGSTVAAAVSAAEQLQQQQQHLHQQQQHQQQLQQASTSGNSAGLNPSTMTTAKDARELQEIRNLLWGPAIRLDVFRRWSQGGWLVCLPVIQSVSEQYYMECDCMQSIHCVL